MYGRTILLNANDYRENRINPPEIPYRNVALDHIGPFTVKYNNQNSKVYICRKPNRMQKYKQRMFFKSFAIPYNGLRYNATYSK